MLTAVAAIVIGMGVPTPAVYILVALMLGPVFTRLGISLFQAHFFILMYAIYGFIIPPIAEGAIIASKIAGGRYMKTAVESVRVASVALLLPFLIIWNPVLLLQPTDLSYAISGIIAAVAVTVNLQAALVGYYLTPLSPSERAISGASVLLLIVYMASKIYPLFFIGLALCLLVGFWQLRKGRIERRLKLTPKLGNLPE